MAAASASFTVTVTGKNFLPSTLVMTDANAPLATTYISSTVLQAQVPASLLTSPGTVTLLPSPVGTSNFGATLTVSVPLLAGNKSFSISTVPIQANDMVWDPLSQQLYLSVASGNGTNPNSITALNPQTGAFGASIATGTEPHQLALSTDSTFLYTGLDGSGSVHRYKLPDLQSDIDIPLGSGFYGSYYSIDLAVQPGNSRAVAVTRGNQSVSPREQGGVLIYDDSVARPQSVTGGGAAPEPIDTLTWNPDGQSLYGLNTETSANGLYLMSVVSTGVQLQKQSSSAGGFGKDLHFDPTTNYLYSDSGKVIDPATASIAATFPLNTLEGGLSGPPLMVTDGRLNVAYFLGHAQFIPTQGTYVLAAYDLTHFNLLGAVAITNVAGTPSKMVRWGSNGIAILTGNPYGNGAAGDGVYLVSGGFVTSPAP